MDTTGQTAPTTGSDATTAAPTCGDGIVDPDETCDDGNGVNGDGCNDDCTPSAALVWEYRSDLEGHDTFMDVVVTADGAIYAAGARTTRSSGEDRWLVRFDLSGAITWERSYDTSPTYERLLALARDGKALYATGTRNTDDKLDLWLGRLDLDGNLAWETEVSSGFGNDYATGLAVTGDGDVIVAGLVKSALKWVDIWTSRYSPDGNVKWTQRAGAFDLAYYYIGPDVVVTPERVVVGHYLKGNGQAEKEVLLAYSPTSGEPEWTRLLSAYSTLQGLAVDPGGDLLATGQGLNPDRFVTHRFTAEGELIWSSDDCTGRAGRAVAIDSHGDIVVVGLGAGAIDDNVRLCKFAADGTLRWGKDIDGGKGNDYGHAVRILPDDRIVVSGELWNGDFSDAWLAVFTP